MTMRASVWCEGGDDARLRGGSHLAARGFRADLQMVQRSQCGQWLRVMDVFVLIGWWKRKAVEVFRIFICQNVNIVCKCQNVGL